MLGIGAKRLAFSGGLTVIMLLACWLFTSESSPLDSYFQYKGGPRSVVGYFSLPAFIAGSLVSGNVHLPHVATYWLTIALQCFALAYVLSLLLCRKRRSSPPHGDPK